MKILDDLGEDAAERVIPQADVVAITGTALTNHSPGSASRVMQPGGLRGYPRGYRAALTCPV